MDKNTIIDLCNKGEIEEVQEDEEILFLYSNNNNNKIIIDDENDNKKFLSSNKSKFDNVNQIYEKIIFNKKNSKKKELNEEEKIKRNINNLYSKKEIIIPSKKKSKKKEHNELIVKKKIKISDEKGEFYSEEDIEEEEITRPINLKTRNNYFLEKKINEKRLTAFLVETDSKYIKKEKFTINIKVEKFKDTFGLIQFETCYIKNKEIHKKFDIENNKEFKILVIHNKKLNANADFDLGEINKGKNLNVEYKIPPVISKNNLIFFSESIKISDL